MADEPASETFGSVEALFRFLQSRSNEIGHVILCPPRCSPACRGPAVTNVHQWTMLICFGTGERRVIGEAETMLVLNSGILNRLAIPLRLMPVHAPEG